MEPKSTDSMQAVHAKPHQDNMASIGKPTKQQDSMASSSKPIASIAKPTAPGVNTATSTANTAAMKTNTATAVARTPLPTAKASTSNAKTSVATTSTPATAAKTSIPSTKGSASIAKTSTMTSNTPAPAAETPLTVAKTSTPIANTLPSSTNTPTPAANTPAPAANTPTIINPSSAKPHNSNRATSTDFRKSWDDFRAAFPPGSSDDAIRALIADKPTRFKPEDFHINQWKGYCIEIMGGKLMDKPCVYCKKNNLPCVRSCNDEDRKTNNCNKAKGQWIRTFYCSNCLRWTQICKDEEAVKNKDDADYGAALAPKVRRKVAHKNYKEKIFIDEESEISDIQPEKKPRLDLVKPKKLDELTGMGSFSMYQTSAQHMAEAQETIHAAYRAGPYPSPAAGGQYNAGPSRHETMSGSFHVEPYRFETTGGSFNVGPSRPESTGTTFKVEPSQSEIIQDSFNVGPRQLESTEDSIIVESRYDVPGGSHNAGPALAENTGGSFNTGAARPQSTGAAVPSGTAQRQSTGPVIPAGTLQYHSANNAYDAGQSESGSEGTPNDGPSESAAMGIMVDGVGLRHPIATVFFAGRYHFVSNQVTAMLTERPFTFQGRQYEVGELIRNVNVIPVEEYQRQLTAREARIPPVLAVNSMPAQYGSQPLQRSSVPRYDSPQVRRVPEQELAQQGAHWQARPAAQSSQYPSTAPEYAPSSTRAYGPGRRGSGNNVYSPTPNRSIRTPPVINRGWEESRPHSTSQFAQHPTADPNARNRGYGGGNTPIETRLGPNSGSFGQPIDVDAVQRGNSRVSSGFHRGAQGGAQGSHRPLSGHQFGVPSAFSGSNVRHSVESGFGAPTNHFGNRPAMQSISTGFGSVRPSFESGHGGATNPFVSRPVMKSAATGTANARHAKKAKHAASANTRQPSQNQVAPLTFRRSGYEVDGHRSTALQNSQQQRSAQGNLSRVERPAQSSAPRQDRSPPARRRSAAHIVIDGDEAEDMIEVDIPNGGNIISGPGAGNNGYDAGSEDSDFGPGMFSGL